VAYSTDIKTQENEVGIISP